MIEVNLNNLHPLQKIPNESSAHALRPTAQACAKVILTGEHAVVYGAHALAIPVPTMGIQLSLKRLPQAPPDIPGSSHTRGHGRPELHIGDQRLPEHIESMVSQACELLGIKNRNFIIEGHSSLLVGAGVGSSAALSVCLLRLLVKAFDLTLEGSELAHLANELERHFHGSPSGLDTTVVAYEQPIIFRKSHPNTIRNVEVQGSFRFVLVDSNTRAATKLMIEKAAPFFKGPDHDRLIQSFDHTTMEAAEALATNNTGLLAAAMNRNCELLRQIGVVNASLEKILSACHELGVAAAKPTGAGGGGCVLALLPPESSPGTPNDCLRRLTEKLAGQKVIPITLSSSL